MLKFDRSSIINWHRFRRNAFGSVYRNTEIPANLVVKHKSDRGTWRRIRLALLEVENPELVLQGDDNLVDHFLGTALRQRNTAYGNTDLSACGGGCCRECEHCNHAN